MLGACGKRRCACIQGNERTSSSAPEPSRTTSCWFHAYQHNHSGSCCQEMPGLHGNTPPAIGTASCFEVIRPTRPRRQDIIPACCAHGPDLHAPGDGLAVDRGGPAGDRDRAKRGWNTRVLHAAIGPKLVVARARVELEGEPLGQARREKKQQKKPDRSPSHPALKQARPAELNIPGQPLRADGRY